MTHQTSYELFIFLPCMKRLDWHNAAEIKAKKSKYWCIDRKSTAGLLSYNKHSLWYIKSLISCQMSFVGKE